MEWGSLNDPFGVGYGLSERSLSIRSPAVGYSPARSLPPPWAIGLLELIKPPAPRFTRCGARRHCRESGYTIHFPRFAGHISRPTHRADVDPFFARWCPSDCNHGFRYTKGA